jgi:hypothetical protein
MAEPSYEELKERVAELERKNGRAAIWNSKSARKAAVSAYGLGRFPVTLYYEQWVRLLDASEDLRHSSKIIRTSSN